MFKSKQKFLGRSIHLVSYQVSIKVDLRDFLLKSAKNVNSWFFLPNWLFFGYFKSLMVGNTGKMSAQETEM